MEAAHLRPDCLNDALCHTDERVVVLLEVVPHEDIPDEAITKNESMPVFNRVDPHPPSTIPTSTT